MTTGLQITVRVLRIANLFMAAENQRGLWCYAIAKRLGIPEPTIDEKLKRMEAIGWLTSEWERVNRSMAGRPRRRIYRITALGESSTKKAMSELGC